LLEDAMACFENCFYGEKMRNIGDKPALEGFV
jgi:hypothetical protein